MKKYTITIAILIAVHVSGALNAQDTGNSGFSAQNFQVSPGYQGFLTVEGAQVPEDFGYRVGAMLGYQYKPLLVRECLAQQGTSCTDWADDATPLIKHHLSAEVIGALSFYKVLELGVVVPTVLYVTGEDINTPSGQTVISSPDGTSGIDDIRAHVKFDLLRGIFRADVDAVGLALVPVVTFPVGEAVNEGSFMGDSSVTVNTKLAFGYNGESVRFGLNAGYLWRKSKSFLLSEVGARLTFGGAVEFIFSPQISLIVESFGQSGFSGSSTENPLEADGALRFTPVDGLDITIGGGAGIIAGLGTPAARGFAGLTWAPPYDADRDKDGLRNEKDRCPDSPEDLDGFEDDDGCPEPDNDKDGIVDEPDNCPLEPEDQDGFEDDDGCPEMDNDKDGLADANDKCPLKPEDQDSFEDDDGCPDPDNDKDGVLDGADACPNVAEDIDQFEDGDGCPDPDNDKDGIPDVSDKCPNEKEIFNNVEDTDGCPDKGEELVMIKKDRIVITQKIHFRTGKARIRKKSFHILDAVVSVLKINPEIQVRVEGHTDSRGRAKYNRGLSERRAKSVLRYLVEAGINPDRLTAEGFGPDRPIESNESREGRAANRRVEFHITNNP